MKFAGLTFIILLFGSSVFSQTSQEKIDQYIIYSKVYIGMTTQQVVDSFGIEKIQVDDKKNFPGSELLDSNLFDEITIAVPKVDTFKYLPFGSPQLHLRLYKGRVFSIHYIFSAEGEFLSTEMGIVMGKLFGYFEKIKFYNKLHFDNHGPAVYGYDHIELWEGNTNVTGIASKYLLHDRHEIEFLQYNKEAQKNYANAWKMIIAQNKIIKKSTTQEIKGGNPDMAEILKDFNNSVINDLSLSQLEKKMPHSTRTSKTIYKKQIDEQGAFWGLYETNNKTYIQHDYYIAEGDDHLLSHVFVVTNPKNQVIGILAEFKLIHAISQLEKLFAGPDVVFSHQKNDLWVYKDLLDQVKIVLLAIEGSELCKHFFVFKKDLKEVFTF